MGYRSVSFVSFVSRHLMIALVRNTKNFPLTKTSRGKKRKTERRVVEKLPYCLLCKQQQKVCIFCNLQNNSFLFC